MAMSLISQPYRVMIVGKGFMGSNHLNKVEYLEAKGKVKLVAVVDWDQSKLVDLKVPVASTVDALYESTLPNMIAVCTNTKSHYSILEEIHGLSAKYGNTTHLLIEKPLVCNSTEALKAQNLIKEHKGYISSGYLFRQSAVVAEAIHYINNNHLTLNKISSVWQKDRMAGPPRPSEGVHIDEATHPIDLIINCILPEVGIQNDKVTILKSQYKRQSDVGQIVDQKKQEELYKEEPQKLDPIAEVTYEFEVSKIPISGFSSFKKAPQIREITLECSQDTTLILAFDVQRKDYLYNKCDGKKMLISETGKDKLLGEWEAYVDYCQNGKSSYLIQTLSDMIFDVRLTEALGQDLTYPHVIEKT